MKTCAGMADRKPHGRKRKLEEFSGRLDSLLNGSDDESDQENRDPSNPLRPLPKKENPPRQRIGHSQRFSVTTIFAN